MAYTTVEGTVSRINSRGTGFGETKATCLWLKNLPPLRPTNVVEGREQRIHRMPPGPDRWKERSLTFQGIADAMGEQWSEPYTEPALFDFDSVSADSGRED
jgi:hypothetical protein